MAELVGLITGGAGLASLALRMAESTIKLKKLCQGYRQAPKTLEAILFELETFERLYRVLESHGLDGMPDTDFFSSTMQPCRELADRIRKLIAKKESLIGRSKVLGRIRVALEESDLKALLDDLDRATNSLSFAYQILTEQRRLQQQALVLGHLDKQMAILQNLQASTVLSVSSHRIKPFSEHLESNEADFASSHNEITRQNTRNRTQYGQSQVPKKQQQERRFSLKFRPWFSTFLWDISVKRAECGWDASLKTYCLRPQESAIFYLAERGDADGMQKLFRAGLASPYDYYEEYSESFDLATVAAGYAQFGICRLLLDHKVTPSLSQILQALYIAEIFGHKYDSALFRLYIEEIEPDVEPLTGILLLQNTPQIADLIVQTTQRFWPEPYDTLDFRFRFRFASRQTWNLSPFVRALALNTLVDPIASFHDQCGRSVLHLLAELAGSCSMTELADRTFRNLVQDVLSTGIDLHGKNGDGHTPLIAFIAKLCHDGLQKDISSSVRAWVALLFDPGPHMDAYCQTEVNMFEPFEIKTVRENFEIVRLCNTTTWSHNPDWGIEVRRVHAFKLWKWTTRTLPGAWPHQKQSYDVPEMSFRYPRLYDGLALQTKVKTIKISPKFLLPMDDLLEQQRDLVSHLKDHAYFAQSDDDTSFIALSLTASHRRPSGLRQRSYSMPHLGRRHSRKELLRGSRRRDWLWGHLCNSGHRLRLSGGWDFDFGNGWLKECDCIAAEGYNTERLWERIQEGFRDEYNERKQAAEVKALLDSLP